MESKKPNQSHDVSQELMDESIANAEERRKQSLKTRAEELSLSEEELEQIDGGLPPLINGLFPLPNDPEIKNK
ncbi:conserved hypothetical protein [Hyella patelloides LEGE 07179]|uniref:Uncharacterized protein n=1 Tax=Hyella patelloides LEGE 07179 TaxID=945734 RepID=A0A563W4E6_9CYAN|nr:hypothetical protein [Hyella patelloides]VEP18554.1 conserved hypothetical protein [Hyella patelloides LEGE 07179]